MNADLMLEMADEIEETGRFSLHQWFTGEDSFEVLHKCGTTACVAGWALACAGIMVEEYEVEEDDIVRPACQALGITRAQGERLFMAAAGSIWAELADEYGWPIERGVSNWDDVKPVQAADVLRRIAKYEVEL